MTTPNELARRHFEAALAEAKAESVDMQATIRAFVYLVGEALMADRPAEDAMREIVVIAENIDPDADYTFMRP